MFEDLVEERFPFRFRQHLRVVEPDDGAGVWEHHSGRDDRTRQWTPPSLVDAEEGTIALGVRPSFDLSALPP